MRTGGFDLDALAVAARDAVAASSPSKNNSALEVMGKLPDCLPLANGSGSGSSASRKLPALAPRPSTDVKDVQAVAAADSSSRKLPALAPRPNTDVKNAQAVAAADSSSRKLPALAPRPSTDVKNAQAVAAADSSRLASYLATASLEQHKPRGRSPSPTSTGVVIRSPARELAYPPSPFAGHFASPNTNVGGGSGSGAANVPVRLQWGHNKRSRGRRDASALPPLLPTPPPAQRLDSSPLLPTRAPPQETPAQVRRRASLKIQCRNAAASSASNSAQVPAEKLMPPPGARAGSSHRAIAFLPPRPSAVAAAGALHGRTLVHQHQRSAEEARAGAVAEPQPQQAAAAIRAAEKQPQQAAAAIRAAEKQPQQVQQQQRPQRASEKEKGKSPLAVAESPKQKQKQKPKQKPPTEVQKLAAPARPELPRIVTQLTRKEKEEDFLAMTGTKLPQRPKKRTKAVEKDLSTMFPGQYLPDVSRHRYMVREKKSRKEKRTGGLKAMESDSD